jgi:uncharacterized membrane protein
MNQPVLIFVGIAAVLFIVLLILRNQKDKKEVIDQIKVIILNQKILKEVQTLIMTRTCIKSS